MHSVSTNKLSDKTEGTLKRQKIRHYDTSGIRQTNSIQVNTVTLVTAVTAVIAAAMAYIHRAGGGGRMRHIDMRSALLDQLNQTKGANRFRRHRRDRKPCRCIHKDFLKEGFHRGDSTKDGKTPEVHVLHEGAWRYIDTHSELGRP